MNCSLHVLTEKVGFDDAFKYADESIETEGRYGNEITKSREKEDDVRGGAARQPPL